MHSKCQALTLRGANKIKRRNYRQQCRQQSAPAPGMHSEFVCMCTAKSQKKKKTPPQDSANTPTQQFIIITVTNKKRSRARRQYSWGECVRELRVMESETGEEQVKCALLHGPCPTEIAGLPCCRRTLKKAVGMRVSTMTADPAEGAWLRPAICHSDVLIFN